MNNMFNAFSISVSGQVLDNKKFYNYDDYDNTSTSVPTDEETLTKAQAYIRLKHVERALADLCIPVYYTIKFGTEGTASDVPSDAEIVVAYPSIEPFLALVEDDYSEDPLTFAASVVKFMIDAALKPELTELFEVQKTYSRTRVPGSSETDTYRELNTIWVTAPADEEVECLVVPIELTA